MLIYCMYIPLPVNSSLDYPPGFTNFKVSYIVFTQTFEVVRCDFQRIKFIGISNRTAVRIGDHGMVDECILLCAYDEHTCSLCGYQLENHMGTPITDLLLQLHVSNYPAANPLIANCLQDPSKWAQFLEQLSISTKDMAGSFQCPYYTNHHNSI